MAEEVFAKAGTKVHYMVGTMIEIPRAALTADRVAKEAEFFSFGTNDLTQTTMGLSRDDYTKFQKDYEKEKIFKADPFAVLDQEGVGKLVKMAVKLGRGAPQISKSESAASTAASRVRCSSATESGWITFVLALSRADRPAGGRAGGQFPVAGRRQPYGLNRMYLRAFVLQNDGRG